MDYEKKYKEAIKKAIEWYNDTQIGIGFKANLEILFPELKESEDEKWIPKEIAKYLKEKGGFRSCWVAWLEKQGDNMGISEATKQKLEDNLNKALEKETRESWNEFLDKQGEQKPAWSEEDEAGLGDAIWAIEQARTIAKDENDMGNLWYAERWLKSLKDRVQLQQKQDWSEEDEDILNTIINHFEIDIECTENDDIIRWLKYLKDRYTWKPSDEQIKVCKEVYADILSAEGFDLGTVNSELNRLEEELKKLREE